MFKYFHYITMAFILISVGFPQISKANEQDIFTSAEFLTWDKEGKNFYISTSVSMAALIVGQYDKKQGKCVNKWLQLQKNVQYKNITETMRKHSSFHPRATLVAMMEKECGEFNSEK